MRSRCPLRILSAVGSVLFLEAIAVSKTLSECFDFFLPNLVLCKVNTFVYPTYFTFSPDWIYWQRTQICSTETARMLDAFLMRDCGSAGLDSIETLLNIFGKSQNTVQRSVPAPP